MILPEKCLKLLRMALSEENQHEADIAAVKFIAELKREGIGPERFEGHHALKGLLPVRRPPSERGSVARPSPPTGQCASTPIQTPPDASIGVKNNPYREYEGEQLQWVYENRHRLSKKNHAAAIEEMERRGLI